ncbi:ParB/RepB/Spo0J family partition protein [Candidatus Parcubacteria bacterium]|nr:MAG: ParB/RepB/Spo0J family partition protein [Candidatus Parcubacteria bacterium]
MTQPKLKKIPITKIKFEKWGFEPSLQESLFETEQKDPIKVRKIEDVEFDYEVVYGRRRLNALMQGGQHTVLALVVDDMDDVELALNALIENSGTPNELDEGRHILYLMSQGISGKEIAKKIGYSPATISQRVRLVEKTHPQIQEKVQTGEIKVSAALEASKLSFVDQERLLNNGEKLTFKYVFEKVREWQANQLDLFDSEPHGQVKPGLFLSSQEVEALLSGEIIQVFWTDKVFNLKTVDNKELF